MKTSRTLVAFLLFTAFSLSAVYGQQTPFYRYSTDLEKAANDRLAIRIELQSTGKKEVVFCLPKMIPGIYGILDFGQYVEQFKALDNKGKPLDVQQLDVNRWKIRGAQALSTITYTVREVWDKFDTYNEGAYLSASSSFDPNRAFVINHNALFGYLEGFDQQPVSVEFRKPEQFYGATSLTRTSGDAHTDRFTARDYHQLVDNPILYSLPDTTHFKIGDVNVTVAAYSTTGNKITPDIAAYIRPLLEHQKNYLGGKLPVDHYTFVLYHNENPDKFSALGDGLEHSNSTLILLYMPFDVGMISMNVYGIASHEFFHTLIPLGIHSEEIAHYDYNNPKLSQHLWLYEGMTEYFTLHMPVKEQVITTDEFIESLNRKLEQLQQFGNERSLAFLSEHAMDFQHDYFNFYVKGALLNLCLDIELRERSNGKYGVQQLVLDLYKQYGPEKAFSDDELFDQIARVSGQPEIRKFFARYVEGTEPLPLKTTFEKAGFMLDQQTHTLSLAGTPTAKQLELRKWWIGR